MVLSISGRGRAQSTLSATPSIYLIEKGMKSSNLSVRTHPPKKKNNWRLRIKGPLA